MHEIRVKSINVTSRDRYIGESTGTSQEGGALNANYRDVEALAIIANRLGQYSLEYGKDFQFKTCGLDEVVLEFKDNKQALLEHLRWT
jgi:hypothetical protein